MYCKKCGEQIDDNLARCPHCGEASNSVTSSEDTGSAGWAILGFFIPIAGLILWLVWKNDRPKDAKMAGKGFIINLIFQAVIVACVMIAGIGGAIGSGGQGLKFIMQAKSLFIK